MVVRHEEFSNGITMRATDCSRKNGYIRLRPAKPDLIMVISNVWLHSLERIINAFE